MTLTNVFISAILQILVFTAIPFLVYVIKYRRVKGFFEWIGLHKPERRGLVYALIVFAAILPFASLFYFLPNLRDAMTAPNTVTGQLRALGFSGSAVAILLVKALLQTSLSEEIFFRGFVAKRLINWLGFNWGNLLQAIIFGAIHLLIFFGQAFSLPLAIVMVLFPGIGGWISGYINERAGNGSIVPSWLLHALINALAYGVLAFG